MGIKSVGYGVTGTSLEIAANVPGGLGKGFLFVGNFLVGVSAAMRSKAAEYRSIARGLDLLDAQTVAIADVEGYAKEHNCSFNEALIVVAGRLGENKGDGAAGEAAAVAAVADAEAAVETVTPAVKEEPVAAAVEEPVADISHVKIVVDDEDGDIRPKDTSAVMNVAAGLA